MARQVLVTRLHAGAPALVALDIATGRCTPAVATPGQRAAGNVATAGGHLFALYADAGTLVLQVDDQRLPLAEARIRYAHDFARKATTFAVNDRAIDYPAWWRDEPDFDPNEPERDADEDYLGYVDAVKRDPALQASLLARWSTV